VRGRKEEDAGVLWVLVESPRRSILDADSDLFTAGARWMVLGAVEQYGHAGRANSSFYHNDDRVCAMRLGDARLAGLRRSSFMGFICFLWLEEEELVKLTPLGVQKLRWDSIEAVTDTGVYPWRRIVLWGVDGRRLTVNPEVVGSSEVFEVELIRRLQEVLRRQADRIRAKGIELHPVRSLALLWLLGSLTFFGVGLVFFVTHTSEFAAHGGANSQLSYPSVEVALFVGGFLSLLGALYSFIKTLHVDGQKLVLRGIWRSMEIPLEKVDSFYVYPFVHRYGTFEILSLHYSGKKFSYSSQRAGYLPLRSYLENVLPASVRQKGEQQAEKQISKELKTVTILSRIGAVLCVGMGIAGIVQANQKLALYHLLKSQGVGAPGVVNYRYTTGSRTTIYLIDYLFKVNGQTYEGASPLPMIPGLMLGRGCQYM